MGILDDAIREHLELRRRNGADAAEVQGLEQSLLHEGPQAEPETSAGAPQAEAGAEPLAAAAPDPDREPAPEPIAEPEPEPAPEPAFELAPVEQPTRQFTAAEVQAAEDRPSAAPPSAAEPAEHDELEETPDFLQETPEHDRLWFEQKPPKDFDF